jgi:copper transport protein
MLASSCCRANAAELGAIVPVWSWGHPRGVPLLSLAAQALVEVGSVGALFSTRYGWLVVTKVALVAVVIGVASLSRRLVAPIAAQTDGSVGRLRGLLLAEVGVTAVVLAVASVLVQTTPARTAQVSDAASSVQSAYLTDKLFSLSVDLVPAKAGINELHLYATTPDGQPADVKEWRVKASLESLGIEPIEATVIKITPDHATGQISLPAGGSWTLTFTLRMTEIDQSTVTARFDVRP